MSIKVHLTEAGVGSMTGALNTSMMSEFYPGYTCNASEDYHDYRRANKLEDTNCKTTRILSLQKHGYIKSARDGPN